MGGWKHFAEKVDLVDKTAQLAQFRFLFYDINLGLHKVEK